MPVHGSTSMPGAPPPASIWLHLLPQPLLCGAIPACYDRRHFVGLAVLRAVRLLQLAFHKILKVADYLTYGN